jgi:hypothetical protein
MLVVGGSEMAHTKEVSRVPATRTARRRLTVVLDAILASTGLAGGLWMVTHPTTWLPMGALDSTPLDDWTLPGIALLVVNGLWPLAAMVATVKDHRLAPLLQVGVGGTLLAWLAIQIPVVGYAVGFQVAYTALALALVALNWPSARDSLSQHSQHLEES